MNRYSCMLTDAASEATAELGYDTVAVMYSACLSAERKGQEVEIPLQ